MLSLGDVCKRQVVNEASHLNARSNFKDFKACDQCILLRFVKSFNLQVAYKMYDVRIKSYSNFILELRKDFLKVRISRKLFFVNYILFLEYAGTVLS